MSTSYGDVLVKEKQTAPFRLKAVERVPHISPEDFKHNYYDKKIPLIITDLSHSWPAYKKWNWSYFKELIGHKEVAIYNNVKSDAYSPVNTADAYTSFGNYVDRISSGDSEWRIFLFNIFKHAPQVLNDFTWPDEWMQGFIKRVPMLFVGGKGSITHMHFDMDLSHVLHTQFIGKKRVLLFPHEEQYKLYRKPFEVMSMADFSYYHDPLKSKVNTFRFPALKQAQGFSTTLEHGDTLFMPAGFWHHMEYEESGMAMSLRAIQQPLVGKLNALWYLLGMRNIDTVMKKTFPIDWYLWKEKRIFRHAAKAIQDSNKGAQIYSPGFQRAVSSKALIHRSPGE